MFSSRFSFLNHWRILPRASLDLAICSQSRLGPWADLRGEDLDHVAVFELVVERDDAPVDLGADHGVADGGVDGVGEVDGRRAGGEVRHVAAAG